MDQRLKEALEGRHGNYIFPFFWQHGSPEEQLVLEMEQIYNSGIRSVCLESRTHEDFAGDVWFRDCDILMREAKRRGMTVWILDDKHFPTGYANGLVTKKYPERRKWHIIERHIDVAGPAGGVLLIEPDGANFAQKERTLIAAVAYRRSGEGTALCGEPVDLMAKVRGKFLYWDVPDGYYRVFLIYKTREGCMNPEYIHMIDEDSVDVLIEAVYEPHYERYKDEFGKTFAGFFSDEPCFGNKPVDSFGVAVGFFEHKIGTPFLALPWRDDLPETLSARLGEDAYGLLPGLWFDIGGKTAAARYHYMDTITALYRDCFNRRLGEWCRARNVEYIGHVIEDMNCASHMGPGAGHYFRSLDGQDMAGIDVVLHQVVPGMAHCNHTGMGSGNLKDAEFYHYVLGKLGASHSNIQPRMKGRAMCEIYGAYGWAEGTPMMKWLTDHMLVRGINHFVPHAYTPAFPNPDCPPHFYAQGNNPQYRDFGLLMEYMNKMCHLLNGGRHVASAALLYHAEAEWCGDYMLVQKPAKALYERQLDYDILPCDCLLESAYVENGRLAVHDMRFPCLIIPYFERLPGAVLDKINGFAAGGLCVIFIGAYPKPLGGAYEPEKSILVCANPDAAAETVIRKGFADITLAEPAPLLRVYHYVRGEAHFVMLFNESLKPYSGIVRMPFSGEGARLNLLTGEHRTVEFTEGGTAAALEPYESCVYAFGYGEGEFLPVSPKESAGETELTEFTVGIAQAKEYPAFTPYAACGLRDLAGELPDFSGYIRYEARFEAESGFAYALELGRVGETAHVWLNGRFAGARICPPYTLDVTEFVRSGENSLVVEVANSMAYQVKDIFSQWLLIPPSGLLGPVIVRKLTDAQQYFPPNV